MATINQNSITFSNVYKDGGTKHGDTIIQSTYNSSASTPSDANFPLVNAVDIDWNDAQLSTAVNALTAPEGISHNTITTTGELIDEVAHLRAQVDALTTLVKSLYAALAE